MRVVPALISAALAVGVLWPYLAAPRLLFAQLDLFGLYPPLLLRLSLGGVLMLHALRTLRGPWGRAQVHASADADATRFEIRPALAPPLWIGVLIGVGIFLFAVENKVHVVALLAVIVVSFSLYFDLRGRAQRRLRQVSVSAAGIDAGGTRIAATDIRRLVIRNRFAGTVDVVYDLDRGLPAGVAEGLAQRRRLARVAYRIEAETPGHPVLLAAGLDEATARRLVEDIGRRLRPAG